MTVSHPHDRVLELLADQTTEGLTLEDSNELDRLLMEHPDLDDEELERVAAALLVAELSGEFTAHGRLDGLSAAKSQQESAVAGDMRGDGSADMPAHMPAHMPAELRARIVDNGQRWLRAHPPVPLLRSRSENSSARENERRRAAMDTSGGGARAPIEDFRSTSDAPPPIARIGDWRSAALGWSAAAAAMVVAALAWWPSFAASRSAGQGIVGGLAERRATLMASAPDLVRWGWQRVDNPQTSATVAGDIIFSSAEQSGYMLIEGLVPNDPTALQYQLWIFDESRDDRFPVDGGVFDVPAGGGPTIVPIEAKLSVRKPVLFAITVEPPGGVVVSERKIAMIAKPE